jgi:hypothetical protein
MTRPGWATVAVIALAGAAVGCGSTPRVPDEAALPLVARTVLQGEIAPDTTEPNGQECTQIDGLAGPWSLCWAAFREPNDDDPTQDYYHFRVYGTFGGETGTGVRWATVRVRLVGEPSNNVFKSWPDGVFEGPCDQVSFSLGVGPPKQATLCGRTTGAPGREPWSYRVTWTCLDCLNPDHADRSLPLYQWVAVPQEKVPTWEIFAELGS